MECPHHKGRYRLPNVKCVSCGQADEFAARAAQVERARAEEERIERENLERELAERAASRKPRKEEQNFRGWKPAMSACSLLSASTIGKVYIAMFRFV